MTDKNDFTMQEVIDMQDVIDVSPMQKESIPQVDQIYLQDALKQSKMNFDLLKSFQGNPEASTLEKIGAGLKRTRDRFADIPENTKNLVLRLGDTLDVNTFFLTPEQNDILLESITRDTNAKLEKRAREESIKGTADSVISNLVSGISGVAIDGLGAWATGGASVFAKTALESAGTTAQKYAKSNLDKTGKASISGVDVALLGANAALQGYIENGLGVERLFTGTAEKFAKNGVGRKLIESAGGEGGEEFLQEITDWAFGKAQGSEDRTIGEVISDATTSAVYGALIGGATGTGLYIGSRSRIAAKLQKQGISKEDSIQIAQQIIDNGINGVMDELKTQNELKGMYGDSYDKVVNGIKSAIEASGTNIFDTAQKLNDYAELQAQILAMPIINTAKALNWTTSDYLDVAKLSFTNNMIHLDDTMFQDPKGIANEIKSMKEEIKRLNEQVNIDNRAKKAELRNKIKILQNVETKKGFNERMYNARRNRFFASQDQIIIDEKPQIQANLQGIKEATGNQNFVYVGKLRVPAEYEVVDLSKINASHINGEENPNFKLKELQNRNRAALVDNAILQERATNFRPEEVLEAPNTQFGSPIVNENGDVIAGNGRAEVIRRAFENPEHKARYIEQLNKLGYNTEGIENPILVRRMTGLTEQQQIGVAEASNVSQMSAFQHSQQAKNDAKILAKGIFSTQDFLNALPDNEKQQYSLQNGGVDEVALRRRYSDAVLYDILGNTRDFESIVLSDKLKKKISNAITNLAMSPDSNLVKFQQEFKDINIYADLRDAIIKSLSTTQNNFTDSVNQVDIVKDSTGTNCLLYAFTFGNQSQIEDYIAAFTDKVMQQKEATTNVLFEDMPKFDKRDMLLQALTDSSMIDGKFKEDGTTSDANLQAVMMSNTPTEIGTVENQLLSQESETAQQEEINLDEVQQTPTGEDILTSEEVIDDSQQTVEKTQTIEDFGEKIYGAKKDLWQEYKSKFLDENKINENSKLSEIFPAPDNEKLFNSGLSIEKLAIINGLRKAIPTKPKSSYKLDNWIEKTKLFSKIAKMIMDGNEDIMTLLRSEKTPQLDNYIKTAEAIGLDLFKLKDIKYVKETAYITTYGSNGTPFKTQVNFGRDDAKTGYVVSNEYQVFDTYDEALNHLKQEVERNKIALETPTKRTFNPNINIFKYRDRPTYTIAWKVAAGKYIDFGEFNTVKEAREELKNNRDFYVEKAAKMKEVPEFREKLNRKRIGDNYRQGNATPADYNNAFGFRGVQFGNWENQTDRQQNLNDAYDGLLDLAKLLNIPTQAISLNGTLGLAFGARGFGTANAHYEPNNIVINLTKTRGAGSLAHEWFHSLDNNLGKRVDTDYLTEKSSIESENIRKELFEKVKNLHDVLKETKMYEDSKSYDLVRKDNYWATMREMSARAFESYIKDKLATQGKQNDFLANIREQEEGKNYPYPHAEDKEKIYKAFDEIFETIKTRQTDKGVEFYQRNNAFIDLDLKTIVLGSSMNEGSIQHEFSHFFLERNFQIWKSGRGTQEFNNQFQQIADVLGITENQEGLTHDQQEMYSSMTEAYLFNKGLPQGVEPVVKSFWNWVPAQYNSVLDIGFTGTDGKIHNPIMSKKAVEYFNALYGQGYIATSPTVNAFTNPTDVKGKLLPADKEERIARKKQVSYVDTEQTAKFETAINKLTSESLEANMDSFIEETQPKTEKTLTEKAKEVIQRVLPGQHQKTSEMVAMAQDYIAKNKDEAINIAFGSPIEGEDFVANTSGIDRAVLIREVMKLYDNTSPEFALLYHNFAMYRSYAGKSLGFTNDVSTATYLREYNSLATSLENKAALIRYGKTKDSVAQYNAEISRFIGTYIDSIINETDESAKSQKIDQFLSKAKEEFGTDEGTNQFNQEMISRLKSAKTRQSFEGIARKIIKSYGDAIPSDMDIGKMMTFAANADRYIQGLNSSDTGEALLAARAIKDFQDYIAKRQPEESTMQKLIGAYAPRFMLGRPATHLTNAASNTIWGGMIKGVNRLFYGKSVVSDSVIKAESQRLGKIYDETGLNLAQQASINDKALLHGEGYATTPDAAAKGIQKVDPFRLLGKSDFIFRRSLYLNTLAHIASKKAGGDVNKANELFKEYIKLGTEKGTEAYNARTEALLVANIGVFTQEGKLANLANQIRKSLDLVNFDISQKGITFLNKGDKGLGTLLAPFVKTPANIIELGARGIASPFTSLAALSKGNFTIENAIDLGAGAMATMIFGILTYMGAEYAGDENKYDRKNDTIKIGGIRFKLDTFGPVAQPLRQLYSLLDVYNGKEFTLRTGLSETPVFAEIEDLVAMKNKPAQFFNRFAGEQLSKLNPLQPLQPAFQYIAEQKGWQTENKWVKPYVRSLGLAKTRTAIDDYNEMIMRLIFGSKIQTVKD